MSTSSVPPVAEARGDALRRRVSENVRAYTRRELPAEGGLRRAGVAVVLWDIDRDPRVLVIRRASGNARNAGQWALPGGRLELGEDAAQAARREAREEVGLTGTATVGALDDLRTRSGFVITPVVLFAPPGATLLADPVEVESIHPVALARLLAPGAVRGAGHGEGGSMRYMALGGELLIYPPTGAILWHFRQVALLGRPTPLGTVAQPSWTRY